MPAIEIHGLVIDLGDKRICIDDLEESTPSKHLFLGETGQGKTTILKTIAGINRLHGIKYSGSIRIIGRIFYTPQEPWFITLGGRGYEELLPFTKNNRLYSIVVKRYSHLVNKRIEEMSYGERRLLEIIKAYVYDPDIYLIDEPFESLDQRNRGEVLRLLDEMYGDGKIIIATSKKPLSDWTKHYIYNDEDTPIKYPDIDPAPSSQGGLISIGLGAYVKRGSRRIRIPSLRLRPGEAGTLRGPNGSGKTSILLGLSGSVRIHGSYRVAGSIGFVPDDINLLYQWATGGEVVYEVCRGDSKCIYSSVKTLKDLGISISSDRFFYEYSDGEKRLIVIISQIMRGVDVLLLDGGLEYIDHRRAHIVEDFLDKYLSRGGIILSTIPGGEELEYIEGLHLYNG